MFWASLAGAVSHPQPRRIEEPGPAEALISEPRARTKRGWGEAQAADLLSVMGTQRTRKRGGPSRECSQNQREREKPPQLWFGSACCPGFPGRKPAAVFWRGPRDELSPSPNPTDGHTPARMHREASSQHRERLPSTPTQRPPPMPGRGLQCPMETCPSVCAGRPVPAEQQAGEGSALARG